MTLESFKTLSDVNVAFASVTESLDYSTPEGRLFLAMLGAFAQYYSDALAKQTSKGKRERVLQGLYDGDLPFGHDGADGGVPVVNLREAEVVRLVFEKYATGFFTCHQIAELVNELGFRTRDKRIATAAGVVGPRPFTKETIKDILGNTFYAGAQRGGSSM